MGIRDLFRRPSRPGLGVTGTVVVTLLTLSALGGTRADITSSAEPGGPAGGLKWQTQARLRHGLGGEQGTLVLDAGGVRFHSAKGKDLRWPFVEIESFTVTPRRLVITSYKNRHWHLPGDKPFRFELDSPIPADAAAHLAEQVGKPAKNGVPLAEGTESSSAVSLPARHRTLWGGSNGRLRFRENGIDYLAEVSGDSRAWRWSDIQTIASPDPYHLRVAAYREIYEFELKQAMPPQLFDRVWDALYTTDLSGLAVRREGGSKQGVEGTR